MSQLLALFLSLFVGFSASCKEHTTENCAYAGSVIVHFNGSFSTPEKSRILNGYGGKHFKFARLMALDFELYNFCFANSGKFEAALAELRKNSAIESIELDSGAQPTLKD